MTSDTQKEQMQLMAMMQVAEAQRRIIDTTSHCFDLCVPVPGKDLPTAQQKCIFRCAANMVESASFMQRRLAKQSEQHVGGYDS